MATPAQRTNTWILDEWYDQAVAGTTGGYNGVLQGWSWGYNSLGQLAQNNTTKRSSPIQIPGSWDRIQGTLGIKSDGTAWGWGYGPRGQTGQNNQTNYSSPIQIGAETTWSFIGMSPAQSYGLKTDGTLWTWGLNEKGCLGLNQNDVHRSSPTQVPGTTWASINIGDVDSQGHALATKTDGTLWSWGYGDSGDLGQNNRTARSSPVQLPGTTWSTAYTAISVTAAGGSYAIKTDGTLWAWGSNNANLGQNFPANGHRSSPTQVGTDTTWRSIHGQQSAPGVRQAFATKTDGSMWSWGSGTGGGLGQGNNTPYNSPKQIGTDTNWSSQTYGINSKGGGIFVKTDGTLWSWGYNGGGYLGHNNTTPYNSPKQIGSGTSWNRTGFLSEWVGNATVLQ